VIKSSQFSSSITKAAACVQNCIRWCVPAVYHRVGIPPLLALAEATADSAPRHMRAPLYTKFFLEKKLVNNDNTNIQCIQSFRN
jgi:hypothetical protein